MPKRQSEEEKVIRFFNHAPLAIAQTIFNVSRGIMRDRAASVDIFAENALAPVKKTRKKRTPKVVAAPAMPSERDVKEAEASLARMRGGGHSIPA